MLKTKYAFHALLCLLKPEIVFDIGSMDGADSKRFRKLLPKAEIIAFEPNPNNYRAMCEDHKIEKYGIKVINKLVSDKAQSRSFFLQNAEVGTDELNRGISSALKRRQQGGQHEEIKVDSVRIDSFLNSREVAKNRVALWIDVEGLAYEVLEGISDAQDYVHLIHVEVETREIWTGQRLESDVLRLARSMGYILVAYGSQEVQRDIILVSQSWYSANRSLITGVLRLARYGGPALSKALSISWAVRA
ncbi:MAG: FkbM family methyltransferase [Pseudomonadota bacterium]